MADNWPQFPVPSVTTLLEDVLRIGVTPNRAAELFNEHTAEDIRAALHHTLLRDAATDKEPLKSRASFFVCSVEKGYAKPVSLVRNPASSAASQSLMTDAHLREGFMRSRDPLAEAAFLAMALDEQARALDEYNSSVTHDQLRYNPGKNSKLAKTAFIRFLNKKLWGEPTGAEIYDFHFPRLSA